MTSFHFTYLSWYMSWAQRERTQRLDLVRDGISTQQLFA
jgi:hypothetical protein